MKLWSFLTLLLLVSGAQIIRAEDAGVAPAPPEIALSGPGRFSSGSTREALTPAAAEGSRVPTVDVFGGGSITFEVAVDAPLGTRLKLVGDLVQIASGGLGAPLQKNVSLCPELVFDRRTHLVAACTLPGVPAVQRLTHTLLTLRTDPAGTGLTVPVSLYPPEEPEVWKKSVAGLLACNGLRRVAVFGEGSALRRFLHERHVAFEDLGHEWPAQPDPRTLYIGETAAPPPPRIDDAPGLRLAWFPARADAGLLPGVYQTATARGGSVWKVTLPGLLDGLSTDPHAQATLAEIFRRALPRGSAPAPTDHDP